MLYLMRVAHLLEARPHREDLWSKLAEAITLNQVARAFLG
jgi:hypothetical protein